MCGLGEQTGVMKRIITDYFSGHSKRGKVQTDETPSVPQVSALDSTTTSTVPDSTGTSANCDTAPIAQASCTTSSVATEKPDDNKKTFQLNWLQKWPWLKKMNTGMVCELCQKHNKVNAMTSPNGCQNYRTSTLERHSASADHKIYSKPHQEFQTKPAQRKCTEHVNEDQD